LWIRGRGRRISGHTEGARQKRKETEVIAGSFPERVWLGFESERTRLFSKSKVLMVLSKGTIVEPNFELLDADDN